MTIFRLGNTAQEIRRKYGVRGAGKMKNLFKFEIKFENRGRKMENLMKN